MLDRPFSFDHECFLCFNKYKIVGKGLGNFDCKCFLCLDKYK